MTRVQHSTTSLIIITIHARKPNAPSRIFFPFFPAHPIVITRTPTTALIDASSDAALKRRDARVAH